MNKKQTSHSQMVIYVIKIRVYVLTHFNRMLHFYTPWNCQKIKGFLKFSRGIEMEHWIKVG